MGAGATGRGSALGVGAGAAGRGSASGVGAADRGSASGVGAAGRGGCSGCAGAAGSGGGCLGMGAALLSRSSPLRFSAIFSIRRGGTERGKVMPQLCGELFHLGAARSGRFIHHPPVQSLEGEEFGGEGSGSSRDLLLGCSSCSRQRQREHLGQGDCSRWRDWQVLCRITELQRKTSTLTEADYHSLVEEPIYWLQQPEVQEDSAACTLAAHRGSPGEYFPAKYPFFAEEVRLNLQQLRNGVAEAMMRRVAQDRGIPPGLLLELTEVSRLHCKKRRKRRRSGKAGDVRRHRRSS
ncbi:uncharacterized protein LOC125726163 [Brienomyrus brachyistius]|uniref:uncharacterized protein LOC125726163 n=1 Tax=Brienomyrus brachyistius TaxID=42636 RepID=UPI0020B39FB4|nr:uncharacterized protein LOC125726163 [Brienomyrus brachyistius]